MENTTARNIETVLADMNAQIALGTTAIRESNLTALNTANAELKKLEKEYDAFVLKGIYTRLNATENPILSMITEFTYETKKSREVKTDGVSTALELVDVTRQHKYEQEHPHHHCKYSRKGDHDHLGNHIELKVPAYHLEPDIRMLDILTETVSECKCCEYQSQ